MVEVFGRAMMPEKSISERAKETLKWIQKEQLTNALGIVDLAKVPNQNAQAAIFFG